MRKRVNNILPNRFLTSSLITSSYSSWTPSDQHKNMSFQFIKHSHLKDPFSDYTEHVWGLVHMYTVIFINRAFPQFKKKSCPHEHAKAWYEALSRACQTNRCDITLTVKNMLANQKPEKACPRFTGYKTTLQLEFLKIFTLAGVF